MALSHSPLLWNATCEEDQLGSFDVGSQCVCLCLAQTDHVVVILHAVIHGHGFTAYDEVEKGTVLLLNITDSSQKASVVCVCVCVLFFFPRWTSC